MSQEIVNFIESFKEFDKNFARYEYESDKYECEIAQIARIQRAANENLKAFWDKQVQNDYFELKHPLYNHIQTRAVANFYNCITNIVFMIDEDNKHPWLLIQVTHACNAFFTPYKAFCVLETWNNLFSGIIGGVQKFITHFNVANASYRNIKFGFLLSNVRPMHYFLNNLADIVTFHLVKKVCPRASFFVPKFLEVNKGEPMVYVYVADGYRHSSQVYNYVADESLQDKKDLIPPDPLKSTYDLTLWLGLPGERRAWLEQVEGTAQILKHLSKYFKKIKVYIDGMTAYDGERKEYPGNKALFNKVVLATKEVFDKELKDKVCKDKEFKDLETQSASKENLTSSDLKATKESLNLIAGGGGFENFKFENLSFLNEKSLNALNSLDEKTLGILKSLDFNSSIFDFDKLKELEELKDFNKPDEFKEFENLKEFKKSETLKDNNEASNLKTTNLNSKLYTQIIDYLKQKETLIVFKSLAGYDYRTKICYASDCDLALSDSGTTVLTPFTFAKLPGVIFYGSKDQGYINFSKNIANEHPNRKAINENYSIQTHTQNYLVWDYHIPWQHIYNLAAEVLEELVKEKKLILRHQNESFSSKYSNENSNHKALAQDHTHIDRDFKIHRLDVPPVEMIAEIYELKQNNQNLKNEIANLNTQKETLSQEIQRLTPFEHEVKSLPFLKQKQEFINLKQDENIKKLEIKKLEKELGLKLSKLEPRVNLIMSENLRNSALARVRNHLAYRLGAAIIVCNKSLWGLMSLPFVLSFIKAQYKKEQAAYRALITQKPEFKLPKIETYPDYEAALKEKECLTYKLGLAMMKADKTWLSGGYVKFYFEAKRLEREFKKEKG